MNSKQILITGCDGFLGSNLVSRLQEAGSYRILGVTQETPPEELLGAISQADFVFHLAGVNRPKSEDEFSAGNVKFTENLCRLLAATGRPIPIAFSSSTQAPLDNPYGRSKQAAEQVLLKYADDTNAPVSIFRLTNVFGKWSRPNYNSVVATFCHNIARSLPITVNDPQTMLRLLYVDDVIEAFMALLEGQRKESGFASVTPLYEITIGDLAATLSQFAESRKTLVIPKVGSGLMRALYATYLSFLPPDKFCYDVPIHSDPRGEFTEMLKTPECGQFSYLTARPGVTRGEHYHHSKSEKFLVIRGQARFQFLHVSTGETHEVLVQGQSGRIVETVPGWAHNITNVGEEELIVLLWANEIFDHSKPDTYPMKVVR